MNVAKNWALTMMLTALAFAHFSSELLLKEQIIIPVKKSQKTLNNAGHIDAKLIHFLKFVEKNPARPIFLTICPWKSFEFWLFSAKIDRFFREFAPENPAKFCCFFFFSAKCQKPWIERYIKISCLVKL